MNANAQQEQPKARALSTQLAERGLSAAQWHTLQNSLFPGAKQTSVLMVVDYCIARNLDPLKKPCHIVPMRVGKEWRDVVLPGIYEHRTTAQRTGLYLGHSKPEYGPDDEAYGVTAPAWCSMIVYRWNPTAKLKAEFPVTVHFAEACGTKYDKEKSKEVANQRWAKAPKQMLTKCTEAAALREAFPDELGGTMTAEEMASDYQDAGRPTSVTLNDLDGPQDDKPPIEGELVEDDEPPPAPQPEDEGGAPVFSIDEIRAKIEKAKNKEALNEAADLLGTVEDTETRVALKNRYLERLREFL